MSKEGNDVQSDSLIFTYVPMDGEVLILLYLSGNILMSM